MHLNVLDKRIQRIIRGLEIRLENAVLVGNRGFVFFLVELFLNLAEFLFKLCFFGVYFAEPFDIFIFKLLDLLVVFFRLILQSGSRYIAFGNYLDAFHGGLDRAVFEVFDIFLKSGYAVLELALGLFERAYPILLSGARDLGSGFLGDGFVPICFELLNLFL